MRKNIAILSILATSLMSYAALAQDEAAAAPPEGAPPVLDNAPAAAPAPEQPAAVAPAAAPDTKFQAGVAFLPMLMGKMKASAGGQSISTDAAFAYGVGVAFGYAVIPGLTVGIAPQLILNVKGKDAKDAAKEYDLMARIAYAYTFVPKISAYVEFLPGYSIISPKTGDSAKGLVLAGGVGGMMDITDMIFVNVGVGYQYGMQSVKVAGTSADLKTSFLRLAVGGGVKF